MKQDYSMKLGEEGEAFFVFETSANIPAGLQTSTVVSPASSPASIPGAKGASDDSLQEPDYLDLSGGSGAGVAPVRGVPPSWRR